MVQLRLGVFETNSSSTHAFVISGKKIKDDMNGDRYSRYQRGFVYVENNNFGSEGVMLTTWHDKLVYVIAAKFMHYWGDVDPEDFDELYKLVRKHKPGFQGVKVRVWKETEDGKLIDSWEELKEAFEITRADALGSIDHQSFDMYKWLYNPYFVERLIFDPYHGIWVGGDWHGIATIARHGGIEMNDIKHIVCSRGDRIDKYREDYEKYGE